MPVLLLLILTSHPVAGMLWAFVLVLHALDFGKKYVKWYMAFAGIWLLLFVYKLFTASEYEQHKTLSFIDTYRHMPYGWTYVRDLGLFLMKYYSELLVLFLCTMGWLLLQRKYWTSVVVFLGFLGMLIVINGAHYSFQHSRYQEQVYFPLSFIVAFPLGLLIQQNIAKRLRFILAMILAITVIKFIAITQESDQFTNRILRMERLIAEGRKRGIQKAVVDEANVKIPTSAGPNWSYGIETLLLSGRDGKHHNVTVVLDCDVNYENNKALLTNEMYMLRMWDIFPSERLHPRHFHLSPAPYVSFQSSDAMDISPDTLKSYVTIELSGKDQRLRQGTVHDFDAIITNRGTFTLPSDTSSHLYLSYHWLRGDEAVVWDGYRTPLEVDIRDQYAQTFDVVAPESIGEYTLVVDLLFEGRGWVGIDARKVVWVY